MPDFLGNIASFFGSPAGKGLGEAAGLGATGAGLIGNLAADRQRAAAAKQAQANANLTPAQLAAQVNQATLPLNENLVHAITQNVSGNLAEQGLSQAPGIQAQAIAQGLAGPEQQNQQTALNLVLQRLGLPAEFARSIPPNSNLSPLIALLLKGANIPAPAANFQPTTGPNFTQAGLTPDYGTQNPVDTTGTYDFGSLIQPS